MFSRYGGVARRPEQRPSRVSRGSGVCSRSMSPRLLGFFKIFFFLSKPQPLVLNSLIEKSDSHTCKYCHKTSHQNPIFVNLLQQSSVLTRR